MDEIFDHLKSIKVKHKILILALIGTEILGILVLIWYLRTPLTQKFLLYSPKSYSVDSMDPEKHYLIKQEDFLTGKSTSNQTQSFLLQQGQIKKAFKAQTDSEGRWYFQIPSDLEGRYIFATGTVTSDKKIKDFKLVKIRIVSNNMILGICCSNISDTPAPTNIE